MAGVDIPLHANEHFYAVTEPIKGLQSDLPVLRIPDECTYYKEDAGKLLIGAFEPVQSHGVTMAYPMNSASISCQMILSTSNQF